MQLKCSRLDQLLFLLLLFVELLLLLLELPLLLLELFFLGTFPPAFLASDRPMAIACLRLVTFLPLRPDFNVPCFLSCIAFSTLSWAFFPYLAMILKF